MNFESTTPSPIGQNAAAAVYAPVDSKSNRPSSLGRSPNDLVLKSNGAIYLEVHGRFWRFGMNGSIVYLGGVMVGVLLWWEYDYWIWDFCTVSSQMARKRLAQIISIEILNLVHLSKAIKVVIDFWWFLKISLPGILDKSKRK